MEDRVVFGLYDKEYRDYKRFAEEHKDCGKKIWLNLQETEIGTMVTVKCNGCKEKKDITNYDLL